VLLKGKDIDVVLATFGMNITLWQWLEKLPPYIWKEGIDANNVAIEELSEEHNVPMVPFADVEFRKASKQAGTVMFDDSIHMSTAGNVLKAKVFADTIAPIIARDMKLSAPPISEYSAALPSN
jgi:hypothetical protein